MCRSQKLSTGLNTPLKQYVRSVDDRVQVVFPKYGVRLLINGADTMV